MKPVKNSTRLSSEVAACSGSMRSGLDLHRCRPARKWKQVMPPKAAMYWSCLPTGSPSRSISMWQACSASSCRADVVLLQRVQRPQQRRGEAARRAQPGARRDVRHAGDFQVRRLRCRAAAAPRARWGAGSRSTARTCSMLRVLQDDLLRERLVQRDVDVLVDGGRDHESRVLAVVGGQVRAAAAERDAQRAAGDDHAGLPVDALDHAQRGLRVGDARARAARPSRMSSRNAANSAPRSGPPWGIPRSWSRAAPSPAACGTRPAARCRSCRPGP